MNDQGLGMKVSTKENFYLEIFSNENSVRCHEADLRYHYRSKDDLSHPWTNEYTTDICKNY
jgi:hypothetical protein